MRIILKYFIKSKYLGFKKCNYHEFNNTDELRNFLLNHINEIIYFDVYVNLHDVVKENNNDRWKIKRN